MPHKDRETRLAYLRAYRASPEEQERRARDRHLWDSAKHANARALHYGVEGVLTTKDVRAIYAAHQGVCHYCGGFARLGLDHVKPLHLGGANLPANIVLACGSCNARKFRAPVLGRWSSNFDACIDCGGTTRKHASRGLCSRCYQRRQHDEHYEERPRKTGRRMSLEARLRLREVKA